MKDHALPARVPAKASRAGEHWILVPDGPGRVAVVNETGYLVFKQCDGSRPESGIAEALAGMTGGDPAVILRDVAAYLGQLEAAGLITRQHRG